MKLYWARDVREADRIAIQEAGIPSLTLMENAARAVTDALFAEAGDRLAGRVVVLCYKGNNGGDGMAVARLLRERGVAAEVLLACSPEALTGDAAVQYGRLDPAGVPRAVLQGEGGLERLRRSLEGAALAVDALLGTGFSGSLEGYLASCVETLGRWGGYVAAVDVPSGLSGDAFVPEGAAVKASLTLTLALPKPCLFTPEGEAFAGRVRVLPIGIPEEATARITPAGEALEEGWARSRFLPRRREAHKGDTGRILVIAGSRGKSGAAVLAARGALRAGAGLVTVATPASVQPVVAASLPEAMTLPLPETPAGTLSMDGLTPLLGFAEGIQAAALGPGLGTEAETAALVHALYEAMGCPLVVDADGLNAFAGQASRLAFHKGPRLLTPHPGEMARLLGVSASEVLRGRYRLVPERAGEWGAAVLLKGYRTLVAGPSGSWALNLSGGAHMAGPGFGDVLTGVAAAVLARLPDPFEGGCLAAYWHGAAADRAFEGLGGYGLLASECADALPVVEGALRRASGRGDGEVP
ncbi:MAG: NAD(P)H-hydrate dehydratase [Acidobacteriota bacterium]